MQSSIHKCIDVDIVEGDCIGITATFVVIFQMDFKYVLGMFRFEDFEILSEVEIEFGKEAVGDDAVFLFRKIRNEDLLSGSIEGELFLDQVIGAFSEKVFDFLPVIEFDGDSECDGVLGEFEANFIEDVE